MSTTPFDPDPEGSPDLEPSRSPDPGPLPPTPLEPSQTNPDADGVDDLQ